MLENSERQDSPLALLRREHGFQLELCQALEQIADCLPDSFDRRLARCAATVLECGLVHYVRFEDEKLFPIVRARGGEDVQDALRQLESEHVRDQAFALEIAEELDELCRPVPCRNPDMLGYMLRGFFEGRRRHIAWENAVIIPVARRVLRPDDVEDLAAWMQREHWQETSAHGLEAIRDLVTAVPAIH